MSKANDLICKNQNPFVLKYLMIQNNFSYVMWNDKCSSENLIMLKCLISQHNFYYLANWTLNAVERIGIALKCLIIQNKFYYISRWTLMQ